MARVRCFHIIALLMTLTSLSTGCAVTFYGTQDREVGHMGKTDLIFGSYLRGRMPYMDSAAALHRARALAERPRSPEPGKKLRFLMWGLHAHRLYATDHELTPGLMREAEDWYRRARELAATDPDRRGYNTNRSAELVRFGDGLEAVDQVDAVYGMYLEETGRAGAALRLLEPLDAEESPAARSVSYWNSVGLARLARGDIAGAREAFTRPDVVAEVSLRNLLKLGRGGDGYTSLTLAFHQFRRRFAALAIPENNPDGRVHPENLLELWHIIDKMGQDTLAKSYMAYLEGARTFADAGEIAVAKALLRVAAAADREDGRDAAARLDQLCAAAHVAARAGDRRAAAAADRCLVHARGRGRPLRAADRSVHAEAYIAAGRLDEAIDLLSPAIEELEATRRSFAVEERAQFFRTAARRSYWTKIRAHGLRAAAAGEARGEADLVAALSMTEQVRARQLGEILGDRGRAIEQFRGLRQLREHLAPGEAVLSYVVTDRHVLVIALDARRWKFASLPIGQRQLGQATAVIAGALARPGSDEALLQEHLTWLGRALLLPVGEIVADASTLTVLPDGVLNTIPFDLLSMAPEWAPLLERMTVRLTPSLGFYLTPRRGEPVRRGIIAFGDPVVQGRMKPLPNTRTELERIATLFPGDQSKILLGDDARESTFKHTPLAQFGAVHFATHGILGRVLAGVTEPALVLSPEDGEDGLLKASEVAMLDLNAEIAVLSACKTGLGDMSSGEGVFGMSRAFLLAGASSVVMSLWAVDSPATEELMVSFYRALQAGEDPHQALRRAKLALRASEADATVVMPRVGQRRWAHPYYWGAFTTIGR